MIGLLTLAISALVYLFLSGIALASLMVLLATPLQRWTDASETTNPPPAITPPPPMSADRLLKAENATPSSSVAGRSAGLLQVASSSSANRQK